MTNSVRSQNKKNCAQSWIRGNTKKQGRSLKKWIIVLIYSKMADGGYLGLELIMSKPARWGAEQMTFTRGRPECLIANFHEVARLVCQGLKPNMKCGRQTMLTTFKRKKDREKKKKYSVFGSSEKCDESALWWETQRHQKGGKKG